MHRPSSTFGPRPLMPGWTPTRHAGWSFKADHPIAHNEGHPSRDAVQSAGRNRTPGAPSNTKHQGDTCR
jgi:hypothetical protein